MPFSRTKCCTKDEWTGIFDQMIKPAVTGSKLGFDCERAKPRTGNFIKDILNQLNTADVVIADLTDMNANVFYELGVRHTLQARTILIAQHMKYVPSDLQSYWVVTYDKKLTGLDDFKQKIREILKEMKRDPEKPDSPVADFLSQRNISLVSQEKSANLKNLTALLSELSSNIDSVSSILATVKSSKQKREKGEWGTVSMVRFDNACIELLLSTSYILLTEPLLREIRHVNHELRLQNNRLDLWPNDKFDKSVEDSLKEFLPDLKKNLSSLLKDMGKVRIEYANDNYIEPEIPAIVLSSPEHKKYIEASK